MQEVGEFSAIIGRLYDAALSPPEWPVALDALCAWLNARTAALISHDLFDRRPPWQIQVGYDPQWMQAYTDKYIAINPYLDDVARLGAGECAYSSARDDYQDLLRSEFYAGWLQPQGFVDGSVLVIDKTPTTIATMVNVRDESQGLFDQAAMDRLTLLYPHIRRAVLIGRIIGEQSERESALTAALDSLAAGVFLITQHGTLSHANAAGQAMLAAATPATTVRKRFMLSNQRSDRVLWHAITSAADGATALGGRGITIPLYDEGYHSAHLLPLSAARGELIRAASDATFIVFIRRNDPSNVAAVTALALRSGLTPQETRVLQTVVDAGGVPLAAEVLGLSATTVRSHITAIFDKTGVRRQADLIRILTEMRSPFHA